MIRLQDINRNEMLSWLPTALAQLETVNIFLNSKNEIMQRKSPKTFRAI